jgi:hypothetical protein
MRDSSGQVGQVLLQLVAQCNFHEWRHQRLQSPACRGGRPASEDQHDPAAGAVNGIDHMIELIVQIRMIQQHAQSMGMFDFCDLELLRPNSTEHDPFRPQARADPNRTRGQQFDPFDGANDVRPVENVRNDGKYICRRRGNRLRKLDLHLPFSA